MSIISSHPLELLPLPRQCAVTHTGSWADGMAGGSNLHSTWLHNPAFTLQLQQKALCRCDATSHLQLAAATPADPEFGP